MPLTATAFTYVVLPTAANPSRGPDPRGMGRIQNGYRVQRIRAELSNASSGAAYPTSGGVPLSTSAADWGMIRNMEYVVFQGMTVHASTATGLATEAPMWTYSPSTHTLFGFSALATGPGATSMATTRKGFPELPTTWTPTLGPNAPKFFFVAHGW